MKINLQQKLTNLFGQPVPKTNPNKEEIKALDKFPKVRNQFGQEVPDQNNLPDETLGNFLISALQDYKSNDLRDHVMVVLVAGKLVEAKKEIELNDKYRKFLLMVLDEVTRRKTKKKTKVPGKTNGAPEIEKEEEVEEGTYMPWATTKAKIMLGDKIKED